MLRAHAAVDAVEPGLQIGVDDVDHRHELFGHHLAIVLRSTPYRLARTVFFSSLAWIASRTLGVVVAEPCVRLASSRPRSRSRPTRVSPEPALAKRPSCAKGRTRSKELMGPLSRQDGARAIISYAS